MPELPEVETVKNTLKNLIIGLKICKVDVKYDKIIRGTNVQRFQESLIGEEVLAMNRIGKYLIFELNNFALVSHLRMEGRFFYRDESFNSKHDHIAFKFDNGMYLVYNDTRKFGTMNIEDIKSYSRAPYLFKLGYEPLDDNLTASYLFEKIGKKQTAIKTALLDQTVISGLGNIYVDEVLFLSGIMPTKKCCELTMDCYSEIVDSSRIVINKAILEGGTTIKSFESSEGVHGRFQNSLNVHTKKNCGVCNNSVTKIKVNGRGTYYCSVCQV